MLWGPRTFRKETNTNAAGGKARAQMCARLIGLEGNRVGSFQQFRSAWIRSQVTAAVAALEFGFVLTILDPRRRNLDLIEPQAESLFL
jgi:hypothetical protein